MAWLPDVIGLGILALCGAAFWLCRRERLTIKGLLDGFKEGPPDPDEALKRVGEALRKAEGRRPF